MPNKKVDVIDIYKMIGVVTTMLIMIICQFKFVNGKFSPINIPKEMWTIITGMITHTFMSVTGVRLPSTKYMKHIRGGVMLCLLVYVGFSFWFGLEVGKEIWGTLGSVAAFLYGSPTSEDA